jgi:hypothetical protein
MIEISVNLQIGMDWHTIVGSNCISKDAGIVAILNPSVVWVIQCASRER